MEFFFRFIFAMMTVLGNIKATFSTSYMVMRFIVGLVNHMNRIFLQIFTQYKRVSPHRKRPAGMIR